MRYYKKLVLLVFIPLISGTVGLMFGLSFANPSISIIGIIGTLLGTIIGAGIGRYFSIIDKRAAYIANAQNVLIIAIKQYNEFTIIKNGFKEFQIDAERYLRIPVYLISPSKWRLSKQEVMGLNNEGDEDILDIIYSLIHLDKGFKDLLRAIDDYNKYKNSIVK